MEFLEVCGEDGKPTGRLEKREIVHAEGLAHRTVHVWVLNGAGEILFQKRSRGKDSHPGRWDVSAAGHVLPGEKPIEAALRELAEELGIRAGEGDLRVVGSRRITLRSGDGFVDNEITEIYVARHEGETGALEIDTDEVEDVKFVGREELSRLVASENFDREFVPHGREYYRWVMGFAP
jgi:isopentenyl-diphosphate delta-isomerase type 1